jgi:hypothetical protein
MICSNLGMGPILVVSTSWIIRMGMIQHNQPKMIPKMVINWFSNDSKCVCVSMYIYIHICIYVIYIYMPGWYHQRIAVDHMKPLLHLLRGIVITHFVVQFKRLVRHPLNWFHVCGMFDSTPWLGGGALRRADEDEILDAGAFEAGNCKLG